MQECSATTCIEQTRPPKTHSIRVRRPLQELLEVTLRLQHAHNLLDCRDDLQGIRLDALCKVTKQVHSCGVPERRHQGCKWFSSRFQTTGSGQSESSPLGPDPVGHGAGLILEVLHVNSLAREICHFIKVVNELHHFLRCDSLSIFRELVGQLLDGCKGSPRVG